MKQTKRLCNEEIVPAQVVDVNERVITLKTEKNQLVRIESPKNSCYDSLLIKTMLDLLRTRLWIPVNVTFKKLLKYDWTETPGLQYS